MNHLDLPPNYLTTLDFRIFSINHLPNSLPNMWCLCKSDSNPTVISFSDQHVSISILINDLVVGVSVVYASNCHIRRRTF